MESFKNALKRQALQGVDKIQTFAEHTLANDDLSAELEVDELVVQFCNEHNCEYSVGLTRVLETHPDLRVQFEAETQRRALPPHQR